jgi:predicted DsbA family dithiol-disulfide isomerase
MLYAQRFVNYTGITADTKEKYTEVIAEHCWIGCQPLKKSKRSHGEASYNTGHEPKEIDPSSPRTEEQIAPHMWGIHAIT